MLSSPTLLGFPLAYDDPQVLGPYRLIARIGGGGMGTVYLGRDEGGRTVAIKSMHARIAADPEFRIRFRLETDAARVIGGRHGAEVIDADPLAPTPWLATEYLLGPPLDEAVEQVGPLPEVSVRAIGAALCEALGQLHSCDVVHRDLKPSNILLTAFGPKVIDFGIARAIGDDRLTRTGTAAGTPAYMSPEQATGGEHTAAGDVFALAGVLVFATTGRGPFGGGHAADLLYRVRYGEPDLTGVPDALRPVLERCLLKEARHRPGTAELRAQLHDGGGEFADHLPDWVLARIAWRAGAVWQITPRREPRPPGGFAYHDGAGSGSGSGEASFWSPYGPQPPSRRRMLAMVGGSAVGVAAAVAGGAWAWSTIGPGGEQGPAASPSRGPGGAPLPVWKAPTLSVNENYDLPPIAVGGLILSMNTKGLVAFDAKSGERRWGNPDIHTKQISIDGQRIYAILPESREPRRGGRKMDRDGGSGKGLTICTLDPGSGAVQNTLGTLPDFDGREIKGESDDVDPTVQPLRTAGNVLYLAARTRKTNAAFKEATAGWNVVAFDLRAGRELWREPLENYQFGGMNRQTTGCLTTCRGNRLLLTTVDDRDGADALDSFVTLTRAARTGDELWDGARVPLGGHNDRGASLLPLPTDSRHVYFGARQVVAHRLSDGGRAWAYVNSRLDEEDEINGVPRAFYGPPALRDGVLYATESGHGLIALDASDGRLLWRQKGRPESGRHPSLACVPLVGEKYVYVIFVEKAGRTHLDAVNRTTHRSDWTFTLSGPEGAGISPVLDEDSGRIVGSTIEGTYAIPLE